MVCWKQNFVPALVFISIRLNPFYVCSFTEILTGNGKIAWIIKDYLIIIFGLLIFAAGWLFFKIPEEITGGGISGVAAVIFFVTKIPICISFLLLTWFW